MHFHWRDLTESVHALYSLLTGIHFRCSCCSVGPLCQSPRSYSLWFPAKWQQNQWVRSFRSVDLKAISLKLHNFPSPGTNQRPCIRQRATLDQVPLHQRAAHCVGRIRATVAQTGTQDRRGVKRY